MYLHLHRLEITRPVNLVWFSDKGHFARIQHCIILLIKLN